MIGLITVVDVVVKWDEMVEEKIVPVLVVIIFAPQNQIGMVAKQEWVNKVRMEIWGGPTGSWFWSGSVSASLTIWGAGTVHLVCIYHLVDWYCLGLVQYGV